MSIDSKLKQKIKYHNKRFNFFKLSQISDEIKPTENEKKKNAEVSTPHKLRQEMLDSMTKYGDKEFWNAPHKVFEPCCGKGGFVVDVMERFMNGLEEKIPDTEARYKHIIEECIYFADINPLNIFITKFMGFVLIH